MIINPFYLSGVGKSKLIAFDFPLVLYRASSRLLVASESCFKQEEYKQKCCGQKPGKGFYLHKLRKTGKNESTVAECKKNVKAMEEVEMLA